jgi:glyoxylase-like metal-dependent hydrolase (beta-lactamase superfamily II)
VAEWYEPSVEEVADGVYRIPLPLPGDGLRAINVYLIAGEDGGSVCIDSGWALPSAREVLTACLATLHFRVEDIERFLVTHIHRDHYTQAIAIRREMPTKVSLGEGEREALDVLCTPREERPHRMEHLTSHGASELAKQIERSWAEHPPTMFEFEMPDDWLREGDVVEVPGRRLDVVETPGHTRGHVVFHDAEGGVLFAGDHVLSTITPSIGVEVSPYANALGDFLDSLARVRRLPDALLFPAHGPVRTSVHARVDELVAHHALRLDNTLSAVRAGADTAFEVAGQLRWTRHERHLGDLDPFNQSLAVSETAAHLVLLEAQGRVHRSVEDGVNHYAVS